MLSSPPFRPGLYLHYKGDKYRGLHLVEHHETRSRFVVYVSLSHGTVNIREYDTTPGVDAWCDKVTWKYRGETMQHRFEFICP